MGSLILPTPTVCTAIAVLSAVWLLTLAPAVSAQVVSKEVPENDKPATVIPKEAVMGTTTKPIAPDAGPGLEKDTDDPQGIIHTREALKNMKPGPGVQFRVEMPVPLEETKPDLRRRRSAGNSLGSSSESVTVEKNRDERGRKDSGYVAPEKGGLTEAGIMAKAGEDSSEIGGKENKGGISGSVATEKGDIAHPERMTKHQRKDHSERDEEFQTMTKRSDDGARNIATVRVKSDLSDPQGPLNSLIGDAEVELKRMKRRSRRRYKERRGRAKREVNLDDENNVDGDNSHSKTVDEKSSDMIDKRSNNSDSIENREEASSEGIDWGRSLGRKDDTFPTLGHVVKARVEKKTGGEDDDFDDDDDDNDDHDNDDDFDNGEDVVGYSDDDDDDDDDNDDDDDDDESDGDEDNGDDEDDNDEDMDDEILGNIHGDEKTVVGNENQKHAAKTGSPLLDKDNGNKTKSQGNDNGLDNNSEMTKDKKNDDNNATTMKKEGITTSLKRMKRRGRRGGHRGGGRRYYYRSYRRRGRRESGVADDNNGHGNDNDENSRHVGDNDENHQRVKRRGRRYRGGGGRRYYYRSYRRRGKRESDVEDQSSHSRNTGDDKDQNAENGGKVHHSGIGLDAVRQKHKVVVNAMEGALVHSDDASLVRRNRRLLSVDSQTENGNENKEDENNDSMNVRRMKRRGYRRRYYSRGSYGGGRRYSRRRGKREVVKERTAESGNDENVATMNLNRTKRRGYYRRYYSRGSRRRYGGRRGKRQAGDEPAASTAEIKTTESENIGGKSYPTRTEGPAMPEVPAQVNSVKHVLLRHVRETDDIPGSEIPVVKTISGDDPEEEEDLEREVDNDDKDEGSLMKEIDGEDEEEAIKDIDAAENKVDALSKGPDIRLSKAPPEQKELAQKLKLTLKEQMDKSSSEKKTTSDKDVENGDDLADEQVSKITAKEKAGANLDEKLDEMLSTPEKLEGSNSLKEQKQLAQKLKTVEKEIKESPPVKSQSKEANGRMTSKMKDDLKTAGESLVDGGEDDTKTGLKAGQENSWYLDEAKRIHKAKMALMKNAAEIRRKFQGSADEKPSFKGNPENEDDDDDDVEKKVKDTQQKRVKEAELRKKLDDNVEKEPEDDIDDSVVDKRKGDEIGEINKDENKVIDTGDINVADVPGGLDEPKTSKGLTYDYDNSLGSGFGGDAGSYDYIDMGGRSGGGGGGGYGAEGPRITEYLSRIEGKIDDVRDVLRPPLPRRRMVPRMRYRFPPLPPLKRKRRSITSSGGIPTYEENAFGHRRTRDTVSSEHKDTTAKPLRSVQLTPLVKTVLKPLASPSRGDELAASIDNPSKPQGEEPNMLKGWVIDVNQVVADTGTHASHGGNESDIMGKSATGIKDIAYLTKSDQEKGNLTLSKTVGDATGGENSSNSFSGLGSAGNNSNLKISLESILNDSGNIDNEYTNTKNEEKIPGNQATSTDSIPVQGIFDNILQIPDLKMEPGSLQEKSKTSAFPNPPLPIPDLPRDIKGTVPPQMHSSPENILSSLKKGSDSVMDQTSSLRSTQDKTSTGTKTPELLHQGRINTLVNDMTAQTIRRLKDILRGLETMSKGEARSQTDGAQHEKKDNPNNNDIGRTNLEMPAAVGVAGEEHPGFIQHPNSMSVTERDDVHKLLDTLKLLEKDAIIKPVQDIQQLGKEHVTEPLKMLLGVGRDRVLTELRNLEKQKPGNINELLDTLKLIEKDDILKPVHALQQLGKEHIAKPFDKLLDNGRDHVLTELKNLEKLKHSLQNTEKYHLDLMRNILQGLPGTQTLMQERLSQMPDTTINPKSFWEKLPKFEAVHPPLHFDGIDFLRALNEFKEINMRTKPWLQRTKHVQQNPIHEAFMQLSRRISQLQEDTGRLGRTMQSKGTSNRVQGLYLMSEEMARLLKLFGSLFSSLQSAKDDKQFVEQRGGTISSLISDDEGVNVIDKAVPPVMSIFSPTGLYRPVKFPKHWRDFRRKMRQRTRKARDLNWSGWLDTKRDAKEIKDGQKWNIDGKEPATETEIIMERRLHQLLDAIPVSEAEFALNNRLQHEDMKGDIASDVSKAIIAKTDDNENGETFLAETAATDLLTRTARKRRHAEHTKQSDGSESNHQHHTAHVKGTDVKTDDPVVEKRQKLKSLVEKKYGKRKVTKKELDDLFKVDHQPTPKLVLPVVANASTAVAADEKKKSVVGKKRPSIATMRKKQAEAKQRRGKTYDASDNNFGSTHDKNGDSQNEGGAHDEDGSVKIHRRIRLGNKASRWSNVDDGDAENISSRDGGWRGTRDASSGTERYDDDIGLDDSVVNDDEYEDDLDDDDDGIEDEQTHDNDDDDDDDDDDDNGDEKHDADRTVGEEEGMEVEDNGKKVEPVDNISYIALPESVEKGKEPGEVLTWSEWSACSVSCGIGQRYRASVCGQAGEPCQGKDASEEAEACADRIKC